MTIPVFFLISGVLVVASCGVGTISTALNNVSAARVEEMVRANAAGARHLARIMPGVAAHVSLLVLCETLLKVTAVVVATAAAVSSWGASIGVLVLLVAALSVLMFGVVGVFAGTVGRRHAYSVATKTAVAVNVLSLLLGPVAKLLLWLGAKLTPAEELPGGPYAGEVELREMVDLAGQHGIVEGDERRMIQSVFDLQSTTSRAVMVPRPEMVWIEAEKTVSQAITLCVRSGHSRIPVIGEDVDDIVGVLYLKDLVALCERQPDQRRSQVTQAMRPAVFVPDSKNLDDLLGEMQSSRTHLAMLVDEYGGIAGLISIEDILEEIVGEIADEYDQDELTPISQQNEYTAQVVSKLSLEELTEFLTEDIGLTGFEFAEDITSQVDTVGGLMGLLLGRVPLPGSTVATAGLTLTAQGERDRRGRMRTPTVLVNWEAAAGLAAKTKEEKTND